MMNLKNHGTWSQYVPDPWPVGMPANVMFSKRDSDGLDWYAYNQDASNWTPGAVKITLGKLPDGTYRVHAPTRDQTALFPQNGDLILEVTDDVGTDNPEKAYEGQTYNDGDVELTAPPPPPPEPTEPTVPVRVTAVQGRIALLNAGLLDQAQAAVDAAGGATAIWWEYAPTWERSNSILISMGTALGLTSDQIDQLFIAAAQIN